MENEAYCPQCGDLSRNHPKYSCSLAMVDDRWQFTKGEEDDLEIPYGGFDEE